MLKVKGKLEYRPNVLSGGNKDSTCGKVHSTYNYGGGGAIRCEPQHALSYCPEKKDPPNLMDGNEFKTHLKAYTFCYHRQTKKMYHKK